MDTYNVLFELLRQLSGWLVALLIIMPAVYLINYLIKQKLQKNILEVLYNRSEASSLLIKDLLESKGIKAHGSSVDQVCQSLKNRGFISILTDRGQPYCFKITGTGIKFLKDSQWSAGID